MLTATDLPVSTAVTGSVVAVVRSRQPEPSASRRRCPTSARPTYIDLAKLVCSSERGLGRQGVPGPTACNLVGIAQGATIASKELGMPITSVLVVEPGLHVDVRQAAVSVQ
jgi:hypothetical protein